MKTMKAAVKRFLTIILAGAMILSLAACGSEGQTDSSSGEAAETYDVLTVYFATAEVIDGTEDYIEEDGVYYTDVNILAVLAESTGADAAFTDVDGNVVTVTAEGSYRSDTGKAAIRTVGVGGTFKESTLASITIGVSSDEEETSEETGTEEETEEETEMETEEETETETEEETETETETEKATEKATEAETEEETTTKQAQSSGNASDSSSDSGSQSSDSSGSAAAAQCEHNWEKTDEQYTTTPYTAICLYYYTCSICGETMSETVEADQETREARSSYGFFVWLSTNSSLTEDQRSAATTAASILYGTYTGSTSSSSGITYSDLLGNITIGLGTTSLTNLKKAVSMVEECNSLRKYDDNIEGLSDLKISPVLMAISELQTGYPVYSHTQVFNVGENLAWGYSDPFDGWYTEEKEIFNKYKASLGYTGYLTEDQISAITSAATADGEVVGHYTNIISSSYAATGAANTGTTSGQTFYFSGTYSSGSFTTSEFSSLISQYETYLASK